MLALALQRKKIGLQIYVYYEEMIFTACLCCRFLPRRNMGAVHRFLGNGNKNTIRPDVERKTLVKKSCLLTPCFQTSLNVPNGFCLPERLIDFAKRS